MSFYTGINQIKRLLELDLSLGNTNIQGRKYYSIPFNQRDFVWNEKIMKQLLSDIYNSSNGQSGDFFLGAIVLCMEPLIEKFDNNQNIINIDIVDGQQRYTSLTILLSVICAYADLMKDDYKKKYAGNQVKEYEIDDFYTDYVNQIKNKMMFRPQNSSTKLPILEVSDMFREHYNKIINNYLRNSNNEAIEDIFDRLEPILMSTQEKSHKNMLYVLLATKDFINDNLSTFDELKYFTEYIVDHVVVVVTATQSLSAAFNVFESLNGRGVGLLPEDLIKNFIIKNIKNKSNYITSNTQWRDFLKNLKRQKSSVYEKSPSDFFDLLFLSNGSIIKKSELFEAFLGSSFIKLNNDIEINDFLQSIKDRSSYLMAQISQCHEINRIDFGLGYSSILSLYDIRTSNDFSKYIKQIARLGFVLLISRDKQIKQKVSELNKIINQNIASNQLLTKITNHINNVVNSSSIQNSFISKLSILKIGRTGDGVNKSKYMFAVMAEKLDGTHFKLNDPKTQIEHLLPITRNATCQEKYTDVEYNAYRHRIGNATIMLHIPNQWNSNDCFDSKVIKIKSSSNNEVITSSVYQVIPTANCAPTYLKYRKAFNYNRVNLANSSKSALWEKDDIDERTQALLRLAQYIWIDGNL